MNSSLRFGIILLMAVLLAVVFVLIGITLGATFTGQVEFLSDTAATWVASLATVVIALLTIVLALETHSMRRLQQEQINKIRSDAIRPDVDLHIKYSEAAFNFVDLVLRNNGSGVAKDVRVKISHVAGKGSSEDARKIISKLARPSFISNGVSTLGPQRELSSYVISFLDFEGDENAPIMDVCLNATITYEDTDGVTHNAVSIIDMAEFRGTSELGGRPAYDAVRQLKIIGGAIEKIAKGNNKMSVNTYSSQDREIEKHRIKEMRAEQQRKRDDKTTD